MNILKKIIFTLIVINLTSNLSYSNILNKGKNTIYYWFSIEIYDYEWKEGILLQGVNEIIEEGNLKFFKKELKENLADGKILIGPFSTDLQARIAQKSFNYIYQGVEKEITELSEDYIFFNIMLTEKKNTGKFKIENKKIKMKGGNIEDFEAIMFQNLKKSIITIGPFSIGTELNERQFSKLFTKHF